MMSARAKQILLTSIFLVGCLFLSKDAKAIELGEVDVAFSPTIEVNPKNQASVDISIAFTNVGELSTVLSTYDLAIGNVDPVDISASHGSTALSVDELEGKGTVLRINLGETLLSVDETHEIIVSYSLEQFMTETGGLREVDLPFFQTTDHSGVTKYTLSYPEAFGPVEYSSAMHTQSTENGYRVLSYSGFEDLSRLYLSVGDVRYYNFFLERTLENTEDVYAQQELIIPPETASQTFIITSLSPDPSDVFFSEVGNYILTYDIPAKSTEWARIQGILVQRNPEKDSYSITPVERKYFTSTSEQWWALSDESVLAEVEKIRNKSIEEQITWIYDYTLEELQLSDQFRKLHGTDFRKGANVALQSYKDASVEDFSDVFIALARAVGIPSRVVSGYVYPYAVGANQAGMFHVWPQYWSDESGWVSVDPAYEEYTDLKQMDVGLHRVIVAISYDADVYGLFPETTDEITLTSQAIQPSSRLSAKVEMPSTISASATEEGVLKIHNDGNVILHSVSLALGDSADITLEMSKTSRGVILPGETVEIPFTVSTSDWYVSGEKELSFVVVAESSQGTQRVSVDEKVTVRPLWWVEPLSWVLTVVAFALFIFILWGIAKVVGGIIRRLRKRNKVNMLD